MKKIASFFSIFALFLVLAMPQNAEAASTYSAGSSSPSTIYTYSLNQWSDYGYWDLRNVSSIPDTAVVTAAKLNWNICTNCGMTYSTTSVALFKQSGSGYYMDSGFYNYNFGGEPVKQRWFTRFQASKFNSFAYIQPDLTILWEDSASAQSGVLQLNESSGEVFTEKEELIEE
ncbi:hypothetical protein ACIQXF_04880 [Lysinibacillus sp. NPDC097231]|uniref:hypothetical protein n=1 Tax=Lysinibacillus sp. NPDC097231 TaxID=3364142 RepID=UPI00380094D0